MSMQGFIRRRKRVEWVVIPLITLAFVIPTLVSATRDASIVQGKLDELSCEDYSTSEESRYVHTVRLIDGREFQTRVKTVECWALLEHPSYGQNIEVEMYPPNKFLSVSYEGRPVYPDRILEEHLELRAKGRFGSGLFGIALLFIYLRDRKEVHSRFKKLRRKFTVN